MKKILLLLLLVPAPAFSQDNYLPGYIIKHNLDTISGFIEYRSLSFMSENCNFKNSESGNYTEYMAKDLSGYRFSENGSYYISKEIDKEGRKESYFLEYLIDGIVELYYLRENSEDKFFIEKNGEIVELSSASKLVSGNNGRTYLSEGTQYKGAMYYMFQDSPDYVKADIDNVEFDQKSLIKLTKKYHNSVCSDYECIDFTKPTKSKHSIMPFMGTNHNQLFFRGLGGKSTMNNLFLGVHYKVKPISLSKKWNEVFSISGSAYDFMGTYTEEGIDTYRLSVKYKVIKVSFGLEYEFGFNKIRPFVGGYILTGFIFDKDRVIIEYRPSEFVENPWVDVTEQESGMKILQYGFETALGVHWDLDDKSHIQFRVLGKYRTPYFRTSYFNFQNNISIGLEVGYGISF